ncbi:hypothetical protein BGZ61DRAFT_110348 [Ilyonectria robusta]|uniref:uncharacterized protein n=1 Tax=Ilyonectria robusta TaxID=1079257 RepID=UPI001E8EC546|nr:uncharacterized protein BGZ61DRAFT_110348 [Ilyonectria robusta]KAH8669804.1 hypothetical protein BGZ61DRAFT_110348 [Ilyonectria robusta]
MSASPSCTPPRRPLHERTDSENNRLGIRLVPYSPPRINTDGSPSSRPVSYADASTETDTQPWPRCSSPLAPSSFYYEESPSPMVWTKIRPVGTPDSRRASRLASSESSSPWRPLTDADDVDTTAPDDSFQSASELSPSQRPSSQSSSRPTSARRKIINVHSNKTFSVHPQDLSTSSRTDSIWSPPPSFSTRNSSYGRQSMGAFSDDQQDRPSSPLTPLAERSVTSKSPVSSPTQRVRSSPRVSPWNYRMIGGVRKVPKTPDLKQKQPQLSSTPSSVPPLPSLPEIELTNPIDVSSTQPLNEKPSFHSTHSSQSRSTLSDRTNYKIYGQSSPVPVAELDSLPASSIRSNYELLGGPSSTEPSVHDRTRPHTRESEANYVVHGGPSSASSVVAVRNRLNPEFSQESLIVAPLRPIKKRSWESFGLAKTRSHDSVRTGSLTSISTIMTQEATRALFVGPATILHQVGPNWSSSSGVHSKPQPAVRPHQWSSQLSTVLSESEGGSEPASRALSLASFADRRSSTHSKHILSMVSSLAGLEEHTGGPSHSRRASLEPPTAAYNRNSLRDPNTGTIRLIRDHDEDGDGLAPLEELRHRHSRTRLGKMLSTYASDRSLRSTASFNAAVPTWAKVYYGSGERKWLAYKPSSESMFSNFSFTDSQAGGLSRSPSQDRHVSDIFSPRRRPRDPVAHHGGHRESNTGSMDITPLPPHPVLAVVRNLKKQTSSIWSPHLGRDRRPIRQSIWEPPSADWEARSELTGRRNAQVAMFVVGFIFPFAWMIAATIPIPTPLGPRINDTEHGHSQSKLSLRHDHGSQTQLVEDDMHRSAMWWRNVNRGMSIIGLLMLGAVIALIVVGTRQGWGT